MNKKLNLSVILLFFISISYAQDIKFGKVSKEEVEEKFYPEDSTAVAAYLYKYRRTYYEYNSNQGFNIVNDYHIRVKIYDKNGLDYGNFKIVYYDPETGNGDKINGLSGFVYNINEKGELDKQKLDKDNIFKERINKFRVASKIAMPNVKEGSVIDLEYSISSPFTYNIDDLEFQSAIPYKKYNAKIEIPDWLVFNKYSKGYYSIPPTSSKKAGKITFTQRVRSGNDGINSRSTSSIQTFTEDVSYNIDEFVAEKIPALKDDEPYVSNINNYYGGITYELAVVRYPNEPFKTISNTWEKVCKTIYDSNGFGDQIEPQSFYKDDVAAATATATNQFEKIGAIFSLVKSKVKWNNYYGKFSESIKKAYKEGTGSSADINLLLTSMLNSIGVNAYPVLVSTRNNGVPFFPTIDGFNYVISMVEFSDGSYFLLDATEPYSLPNILPERALNWNGRKVTKEGFSNWVKLTPNKLSEADYNIIAKITGDGTIEGLLRKRSDNLNAMQERNKYNHIKEEDLIKIFEERYDIEIDNFRFSNQLELDKPLNYMAKFSSEDLVESISGKLYLYPLLFLTSTQNPFKSDDRKFPVDFGSPWKNTFSVSIQIPEGFKVESSPEPMAIALPDEIGLFKYQVTVNGSKIVVNSFLEFKESIIGPNYYQTLKQFFNDLVAKQTEKIVLVKQ